MRVRVRVRVRVDEPAESHVLAITLGDGGEGEEELAAVGVGSRVGHREQVWSRVLQVEVFIVKLATPDGLSTTAITSSEVSTLCHEACDHAMEAGAGVGARYSGRRFTLGAIAKSCEILDRLGHNITEEPHDNTSSFFTANADIEVDLLGDRGEWITCHGEADKC